jgi:hypothetical protein
MLNIPPICMLHVAPFTSAQALAPKFNVIDSDNLMGGNEFGVMDL